MKSLYAPEIDASRDRSPRVIEMYGSVGDWTCGVFIVPSPIDSVSMRVIATAGEGWDHVSVSRQNRCPNWPEMCHVKSLFFAPDECVIQYHPPERDYVNNHPYCLHLWRPQQAELPRPPSILVGHKELGVLT